MTNPQPERGPVHGGIPIIVLSSPDFISPIEGLIFPMRQLRITPLIWLFTGSALLSLSANGIRADEKDTEKKEAATEAKPEKAEAKAWPPENTEKHEVKRDEDQKKGLLLHTPKTWKKQKPNNKFRLIQFEIPAAEGEKAGELYVSSFAGGGGGLQANIDRWISQFQAKDRKIKVTQGEGKQGFYALVDIQGTYNMPDGPPIQRKTIPVPNARMLAAITVIQWGEGDDKKGAVYFLKMAGPEKTISANEEAFRQSFGAAPKDKEKELKIRDESAGSSN